MNHHENATQEDWDPVAGLDPKAVLALGDAPLRSLCEKLVQDAKISMIAADVGQLESLDRKLEAILMIFVKHESSEKQGCLNDLAEMQNIVRDEINQKRQGGEE